jgi:hypothetical protein
MNIENGIWVTIAVKKNLGNYENVMFEGGASLVGVDPKDKKAWDELWNLVDDQISSKLKEIDADGQEA